MVKLRWIKLKLNERTAATLTELLIVIAVMGVAMLPASRALLTGFQTFVGENENMERVYDAHTTLEIINDKIRFYGTEVYGGVKIQNRKNDGSSDLELLIGDEDDGERIYLNKETNEIISLIESKQTVLLNHVQSMNFDETKHLDEEKNILSRFDIEIVIDKKEYGEQTFSTTIYLRNK